MKMIQILEKNYEPHVHKLKISLIFLLVFFLLIVTTLAETTTLAEINTNKYYELKIENNDSKLILKSIKVKPLTKDIILDNSGEATYILEGRNIAPIYQGKFSLRTNFLLAPNTDRDISQPIQRKLLLNIPYYSASKIVLKEGETMLLSIDVSQFDLSVNSNQVDNLGGNIVEVEEPKITDNQELTTPEELQELTQKDFGTKEYILSGIIGLISLIILVGIILIITSKKKKVS